MKLKTLFLSTAAAFAVTSGAQAAISLSLSSQSTT